MSQDASQSQENDVPTSTLPTIIVTAEKDCGYGCGEVGIPLLPVVMSKMDYQLTPNDKRYFAHSLASTPNRHTALASLPSGTYFYVYIQDSDGNKYIEEYLVGTDGSLKHKFYRKEDLTPQTGLIDSDEADDSDSNATAQPFNCTRKEHNTLDSKFIRLYKDDIIWLMVSHAKLSTATLKRYYDDEGLRTKRMQKFVVNDLMANPNTAEMTQQETGYVQSVQQRKHLANGKELNSRVDSTESQTGGVKVQGSQRVATALHGNMQRSIDDDKETYQQRIDAGTADDEDKAAYDLLNRATPMMVALQDPVGDVIAAAEKRNYLIHELSQLSENPEYIRKTANALIIKNLETASIKTTQFDGKDMFNWGDNDYLSTVLNKLFSDTDPDTLIFKHIDEGEYRSYLQASSQVLQLKAQLNQARNSYIQAITNPEFIEILNTDFDIALEHDDQTAKGYEAMIAKCITGLGVDDSNLGIPQSIIDSFGDTIAVTQTSVEDEFVQALYPQLQPQDDINESWLLKALAGLDAGLINILHEFDKKDRGSEVQASGYAYATEHISTQTLRRIEINSQRSAMTNKNQLINTLSHNLLRLKQQDPKAFASLHLKLEASIYGHTGLKVVPQRVTASMDTMAHFANLVMGYTLTPQTRQKINAKAASVKASVLDRIGAVTGKTLIEAPSINNAQQAQDYVLYYFEKATSNGRGVATLDGLNNGQPIDLDKLDADKLAAVAKRWHGKLSASFNVGAGGISAGVAFFQFRSVLASMPALTRLKGSGDALRLSEAQLGAASTSLALVTASMDATASGANVLGKTSFANKLIYRAGWVGVVGAVLEVGSLAIYGYRKYHDGNEASVALAIGAGFSITASAVAGLLYGYGVVSAGSVGTLAIPGAVLLGIMLIGLALSYVSQRLAYKFDDKQNTLIEYWLDNSVFGHRAMRGQDYAGLNPFQPYPAFADLAADISGFITATATFLPISQLQRKRPAGGGLGIGSINEFVQGIRYQSTVTLANFDASSELHIEVLLKRRDNTEQTVFSMSVTGGGGQPLAVIHTNLSHVQANIDIRPEGDNLITIDTGTLYFDKERGYTDMAHYGRVVTKYTADSTQHPPYPLYDISYMDNTDYNPRLSVIDPKTSGEGLSPEVKEELLAARQKTANQAQSVIDLQKEMNEKAQTLSEQDRRIAELQERLKQLREQQ